MKMKNNVYIVTAIIVLVTFCKLEIGCTASPLDKNITLKGNVMCNTAVDGEVFIKQRLPEEHELVFFAVTGTKEVDNIVSALLDAYFPAEGMNTDQAQGLIDGFKRELKFFLKCDAGIETPGQEANLLKILGHAEGHKAYDYVNLLMELTGKIEIIGNKKYFSVVNAKELGMDYSIYPDRMKIADVPFKPNTDIPDYVLKLNKAGSMTAKMKYIHPVTFCRDRHFISEPVIRTNFLIKSV